jgi:hypothetical protein
VILHGSGSAKRIEGNQFPLQRRAGVGLRCTVVTGKHGPVNLIARAGSTMARVGDEWQSIDLGVGIATGVRESAPAKIRNFDGAITALA